MSFERFVLLKKIKRNKCKPNFLNINKKANKISTYQY